jgi:RNA polymerase sigma-70 factor (ECF subfamily)
MDAHGDSDRVRRCLGGDPDAFEELVVAYQGVLFHLALRMTGNREDARDLTQTVFLKAYRNLASFDHQYRFYSWIYRIMMNEALNLLDRRKPSTELDERLPERAPGPEEDAQRRGIEEAVQCALMTLSPADRQVLVLRHFEDLSYLEIADVLGIPDKTVKSRLFTARQRLGEQLRRMGIQEA